MLIDVTGTEITPGNGGKDCLGNGEHFYESGEWVECCCEECDYMMCCVEFTSVRICLRCKELNCPRKIYGRTLRERMVFLWKYILQRPSYIKHIITKRPLM